jgi:arylformamidase
MLVSWGSLTQAERDAAYNNVASVKNSAELNRVRVEASALYRAAHADAIDLPYGPRERNKWDIYPGAKDAPCLVFIHGGYWQMNRREAFACLAEAFVLEGWSVAMPGYSLAPEVSLTEIVKEIRVALDWLAKNGVSRGLTGPLVISGWSAGGHLAALVLDHPAVTAGLAISGIYELGPLRDTYLNEKLKLSDQEIKTLSPLRLPAVAKPLTVIYGTKELPALVNDARELHAMRAAAHMPGALVPVPAGNHFTVLVDMCSRNGEIVRQARALLS